MAKSSAGPPATAFRCTQCGWRTTKWAGRCGECQAWGTVEEAAAPALARTGLRAVVPGPVTAPAVPIGQVDATAALARPTGLGELDRVLGGGLVPGAVLLLAGEPGVGKSTLLLEACAQAARAGPVLYVTGEESAGQVRLRADRIGAVHGELFLAAESGLAALLGHVEAVNPRLLVVDSVQTIAAPDVDGTPGGVTQVRAVASALAAVAKERMMTTVLVGHVTKDGAIAGPRALEHLVDVVLHFEGDRHSQLRIVRAVKNRYGPTDEIGCFDLGEYGLIGLPDPSSLFLSQRCEPVPGTCVTVAQEGRRALLAEVQALVGYTQAEIPRRVTSGLDAARVGMLVAVLKRRTGLKLGGYEVYAATVGGVRLYEPAVDLAVALAIASSTAGLSVPGDVVAIGEVGLAGEVRRVPGLTRRVAEAQRLGFRRALVPVASGALPLPGEAADQDAAGEPMEIREVADVSAAIAVALGDCPAPAD
jgi:DNA repair protein RadA/Sms